MVMSFMAGGPVGISIIVNQSIGSLLNIVECLASKYMLAIETTGQMTKRMTRTKTVVSQGVWWVCQ
jgi:hypothetical protein